jgi:hypothetical protein
MQQCGLRRSDAALFRWHVIGMFAPGFFTDRLIKRFGALPSWAWASSLFALCASSVALSGVELRFCWQPCCVSVGWNFLFTGGTTLSLST